MNQVRFDGRSEMSPRGDITGTERAQHAFPEGVVGHPGCSVRSLRGSADLLQLCQESMRTVCHFVCSVQCGIWRSCCTDPLLYSNLKIPAPIGSALWHVFVVPLDGNRSLFTFARVARPRVLERRMSKIDRRGTNYLHVISAR